ncbi:bis(5'-nucleosyl)-tetraphosphatase (symmetrical) YqeK [Lachnospiraceae bacterium OttesenSCG-928-D06]|nr:bis(5'-nucleosyl)-tetraphosphatase (symmetrical) YqeK [Lachnospiraceae bacterium OttesenSCG-928-D06]
MKSAETKKIRKAMEKNLDVKRFEHTLGVAYTAASIAMYYDADIKNSELAGLLHDCAKCISHDKKIVICEKHNINISNTERQNPDLLHCKVGSFLAMEEYHVTDLDVINAILNHTTGRPGMSLLEKIVFVADYIEPNRRKAPNLKAIRKLAFQDLDMAVLKILEDTISYLTVSGVEYDKKTEKSYEYYKNLLTN